MNPLSRSRCRHLGFALGCFAGAIALTWWGPIVKPTFYLSLLLFMVGGIFVALLIQSNRPAEPCGTGGGSGRFTGRTNWLD